MNNSIPLTQPQAYVLAAILIAVVIFVNIFNAVLILRRVSAANVDLSKRLADLSKRILINSGYIKGDSDE